MPRTTYRDLRDVTFSERYGIPPFHVSHRAIFLSAIRPVQNRSLLYNRYISLLLFHTNEYSHLPGKCISLPRYTRLGLSAGRLEIRRANEEKKCAKLMCFFSLSKGLQIVGEPSDRIFTHFESSKRHSPGKSPIPISCYYKLNVRSHVLLFFSFIKITIHPACALPWTRRTEHGSRFFFFFCKSIR